MVNVYARTGAVTAIAEQPAILETLEDVRTVFGAESDWAAWAIYRPEMLPVEVDLAAVNRWRSEER